MKVSELIEILKHYPQSYNIKLLGYDYSTNYIDDNHIYISHDDNDLNLYIDADYFINRKVYNGISLTQDISSLKE